MNILNNDGVTGSMKQISFSHLEIGKKGKLLKKNFTINRPQTLFGPAWANLKSGRCVHCGNKLVKTRSNLFMCSSKKHKKPFVISESKFNELVAKQTSGREIYID